MATILDSGTFIVLDTSLDKELEAEGYARDLIREIQDTRKANNLHVADRIKLFIKFLLINMKEFYKINK